MAAPPKTKPAGPAPSVRYAATRSTDRRSPTYAHGKASAQAVLDTASAVLKSHWDPLSPKLETDFANETKRVLPKLGIKNISDATVSEIAQEAVNTSLDAISTVQSPEQIGQALADGLARTIAANIDDPKLQQDKIYEQVLPQTEAITTANAPELEIAASLGNILQTLTTSPSAPIIAEHINQKVEEQVTEVAPLAAQEEITGVEKNVNAYVQTYQQILVDQLEPILEGKTIPTLEQLQTIKEQTHNLAIETVPEPSFLKTVVIPRTTTSNIGTQISSKPFTAQVAGTVGQSAIIPKTITTNIATSIGFKPFTVQTIEESGLGITQPRMFTFADAAKTKGIGVGIGLSTVPQVQASTFNALITNNGDFNQNFLALTKRLEELEKAKKSGKLSRHEKLERKTLEEKVRLFSNAKKDEIKNPKKIKALRSFFTDLKSGNRLMWASTTTQEITNIYGAEYADISSLILKQGRPSNSFIYQRFRPGINKLAFRFAPQAFMANPNLLAGKARGSLGFRLGSLPAGNLSSIFKNAFSKGAIKGGMGMNPAVGFAKKIRNTLGAVFGGLGAYFLMLGQAAFTGFVIGATIGLTSGAILGAALPVMMLGPAGVLLWPVTIPLGAFAFGIVGGVAGGLIALGLASGSTTAVSAGIGAGVGGVVGGYLGFLVGGAISGAFITFAAAACATTLVGCVLVPIAAVSAPVITLTFTALGALAGAIICGFAGYVVGKYLIDPISNLFESMGNGISGISIGTPSFLGTIGGWFTSAASLGWNAVTGALSSFFSTTTGIIGGIPGFIGSLGSAAVGTTTTMISLVGGTTGMIAGLGTLTVIGVGAAFFSLEAPVQNYTTGDNQYFTINKVADKTNLNNPPPNQDVTFTITLKAKATRLTNIQITDEMNYQNKNGTTSILQDKNGQAFSPVASCQNDLAADQTCTATITINITDTYKDSFIINTVKVTATPEGQASISDSKIASVTVGNPPTNCFIFEGNWTNDDKNLENNAIAQLARSSAYISRLCSTGTVKLKRINSDSFNWAECPNTINISDKGVGNQSNTIYALAHETGHILQCAGQQVYQDFLNASPWSSEGFLCSYPLEKTSFEDFAETIAVYVAWHDFTTPRCSGSINYPTKYPDHYRFAKDKLFGGFEY